MQALSLLSKTVSVIIYLLVPYFHPINALLLDRVNFEQLVLAHAHFYFVSLECCLLEINPIQAALPVQPHTEKVDSRFEVWENIPYTFLYDLWAILLVRFPRLLEVL